MRYFVTLPGGEEVAVDIVQRPCGGVDVHVDGEPVDVDAVDADGATNVRVGEQIFDVWLDDNGDSVSFVGGGQRGDAIVDNERTRFTTATTRLHEGGHSRIEAPMPGRVVKLLVKQGDCVEAGTPCVVVEAMKMENELTARQAGVVGEILVKEGQNVDNGTVLVELNPVGPEPTGT
jgi:biotin carboxyl carrier protein